MPNHPILFAISFPISILCLLNLARLLYLNHKYGRISSTHFYYSDEYPPLTREQYIEIAGIDPLNYPVPPIQP